MLLEWGHNHELKIPEGWWRESFKGLPFKGHGMMVSLSSSSQSSLDACSAAFLLCQKMFCLIWPPLLRACRWCYLGCFAKKYVGLSCPSERRESERASYNYWRTQSGLMPRPWGPLNPLRMITFWQDEKIYFKVTLTILTPKVLAVQKQ